MKAVVLVGHGSRAAGFQKAMEKTASRVRARLGCRVECAYLEIASPSISEAIEHLARSGATTIILVPYFVLGGRHVGRDIPNFLRLAKKQYRGKVRLMLAPYLGFDERLAELVMRRIRQAK